MLKKALDKLQDLRFIVVTPIKGRGHKTSTVNKRKWSEITQSEQTTSHFRLHNTAPHHKPISQSINTGTNMLSSWLTCCNPVKCKRGKPMVIVLALPAI